MVQTYEEALNWMLNRTKFGIVPGLQRMEEMLSRLGNPEQNVKAIHVGGTNGKGSTIAYLQSILLEAGYTVGTFTSPYIIDYLEQIMFCGEMIEEKEFISLVNIMIPIVKEVELLPCGSPTEFEIITAIVFYYFGNLRENDFFLVEVGLGGLEDCTNVITPLISIITSVGHDHQNILGSSIEEIAFQKAGIIKKGIPTITAELNENALNIIQKMAIKNESSLFEYGKDYLVNQIISDENEIFNYTSVHSKYDKIEISMLGEHQIRNASSAIMAIDVLQNNYGIKIKQDDIKNGLIKAYKPGRIERISTDPFILIDGAHNVEGIKSLVHTMKSHFSNKNIIVVFSALKDKNVLEMVSELKNISNNIVLTTFDFPRAMTIDELEDCAEELKLSYEKDFKIAIEKNKWNIQKNEILVITGSLYFISNVRQYLIHNNN